MCWIWSVLPCYPCLVLQKLIDLSTKGHPWHVLHQKCFSCHGFYLWCVLCMKCGTYQLCYKYKKGKKSCVVCLIFFTFPKCYILSVLHLKFVTPQLCYVWSVLRLNCLKSKRKSCIRVTLGPLVLCDSGVTILYHEN